MRLFSLAAVLLVTVGVSTWAQAETKHKSTAKSSSWSLPPASAAPQAKPQTPEMSSGGDFRHGLHFDAFLEPEFRLSSKDETPQNKGFSLNDAAFYVTKDFGRGLSALIELPFASASDTTLHPSSTFTLPADRAQAYFKYDHLPVSVKFGQFATPFGYEQNDSRDRFFSNMGLIKSYLLPRTHEGVSVGAGFDNFSFSVLAGNMVDYGNTVNQNYSFGGQARYDAAKFYAALGLLGGDDKTQTTQTNYMLIDVMGGMKMDRFHVDASFDSKKTPGYSDTATGFGLFAVYDVPQYDMGIGARLEITNKPVIVSFATNGNATSGQIDSAYELAVGPSYHFTRDVTMRGDLTYASLKPGNGASDTNVFGIAFSVLASL